MIKISAMAIDFYDDISLASPSEGMEMPHYVKTASLVEEMVFNAVSDDMFGAVAITKTGSLHRKYPLFDKAHTWMSCQSFEKTATVIPYEMAITAAGNIKKACMLHGVEPTALVVKLAVEKDPDPRVKIDESKSVSIASRVDSSKPKPSLHAVQVKTPGGLKNMYPLNTKEDVKKAIEYMTKNMNTMPNDVVKEFVGNLAKAAKLYDIKIPDSLMNIANNKAGTKAPVNIMARKTMTSDRKVKAAIEDIADKSKVLPAEKTAALISAVDNIIGLSKYNSKNRCPYELVSEDWVKTAAEIEKKKAEGKIDGIYTKEDIQAFIVSHQDELTKKLPYDLVNRLMTDPMEEYKTLSDVQKQIIRDEMADA